MLVKALVLNGDHGMLEILRDLVNSDDRPVGRAERQLLCMMEPSLL
ncbi:MAG: hypothetical protein V8S22_08725 [Lachnospiraceae bacterium]